MIKLIFTKKAMSSTLLILITVLLALLVLLIFTGNLGEGMAKAFSSLFSIV